MARARRSAVFVGLVLALPLLLAGPAGAVGSLGIPESRCTKDLRCVVGTGAEVSGGTSATGGQRVAECVGAASGSSIIEVTCQVEGRSVTRSYTGSAGAAEVSYPTNSLDPAQVCWEVTAFFANAGGGVEQVTIDGCTGISV